MTQQLKFGNKVYAGDELVDSSVAALITGLSKKTIDNMAYRRQLPMYKIAKRANRFRVRELMEWVEAKNVTSNQSGGTEC